MGQLWNIKQVRKFFGVSRATIYRWIKAGKIPKPAKPGGSPRWDAEELFKMVKAGRGT